MDSPFIQNNKIDDLELRFQSHQHTGYDGSQRLALLDWKLIARNTLAVAATSLVMDLIPSKSFMRVFIQYGAKTGSSNNYIRFNNDSGSNYTFIEETTATARTSRTEIDLIDAASNALGYFHIIDIVNYPSLVKSITAESIARITSAATAQSHLTVEGTWVNTTAAITRIDLISSGVATFPVGTSIAVFGVNF